MEARCGEMEFSLDGEEEDERVENVPTFRYLGIPLDQTDYEWMDVRRNIISLRREGAETKVSEIFYRLVVQAILLYRFERWVLLDSMAKRVEGTHTEFLRLITGKRARRLGDGTWEIPGTEGVREASVIQSMRIYIEQRQATVGQWVALRPLFEVCERETGFKGGGRRREAWWRQEETEKKLRATLEDLQKAKGRIWIVGEMGT